VFSSIKEADERSRLAGLRNKVFEFMREQINAGTNIVRGNGSGLKVDEILVPFAKRYGMRLNKREMLQQLADLQLEGLLQYVGGTNKERHTRAGFRLGPRAATASMH